MNRIFRYIFLLFAFCILPFATLPALADNSNWGVQSPSSVKHSSEEASQKVWEKEQNENLYENYGSQDSPSFLNREGVDPATSEYNEQYDYEDDAPYDYEAGGD